LGHSSLKKLALSPATEQKLIDQDLEVLRQKVDSNGKPGFRDWSVKEIQKQIQRLEAKYEKLKQANNADDHLTFEQLGIDDITVDEAHEFKNLKYQTSLTNVAGMGSSKGSDKANDLYNKIRYLQSKENSGICFLTGTPLSNSPIEMYSILRYLNPQTLKQLNLEHFDAFQKHFVDVSNAFEVTPGGNLKQVSRLGRTWSNMNLLMNMYQSIADQVTTEQIKQQFELEHPGEKFPIPETISGNERDLELIEPTAAQLLVNKQLSFEEKNLPLC